MKECIIRDSRALVLLLRQGYLVNHNAHQIIARPAQHVYTGGGDILLPAA